MNVVTTCGCLLLALGQADVSSVTPPAWDVETAVEKLAAGQYETRRQATEFLWSAGEAAIPALEKVAQHRNREVRERAGFVLLNIRQGIAFDTPRDVLREVHRFRSGNHDEKRAALAALVDAHCPRIVLGLIQHETDSSFLPDLSDSFERSLQLALLAGADDEVLETLRIAADHEEWIRHWVAYVSSRGLLEEEIARCEALAAANPSSNAFGKLAHLWRAKGDLSKAREAAEQAAIRAQSESPKARQVAGDRDNRGAFEGVDLAWELILEQRDWAEAARRMRERYERDPDVAGKDPEVLGFAAAYHRLAGDEAGFERFKQLLVQLADDAEKSLKDLDPRRQDAEKNLVDKQWYVGKSLLLNGCYDEAVQILRRHHSAFAFELLAHQQRFQQAFELAGVTDPSQFDAAWFEKVANETAAADESGRQRFAVALHAVRRLHFLGLRTQATEWLGVLQRSLTQDAGTVRRRMFVDTAVKLGRRSMAIETGAMILQREGSPAVLSVLYPDRHAVATMWWEYFREERGRDSLADTLGRIDRCLRLQNADQDEILSYVTDLESRAAMLTEPKRSEWWNGLAETCSTHGQRELAIKYFQEAAIYSSSDSVRLGDLYAADGNWTAAAQWYQRAAEFEPTNALNRYLLGQALLKAGKGEGEAIVSSALLLPLADDAARRQLAAGLKQRGYREESLRQFELLAATAVPGEHDRIEAMKQIGNAIYPTDELRAANCWEAMVLCCLRNKWGFADANGYVQIPFLVHKTRAAGLVKKQQWDALMAEVTSGLAAAPANLEFAEELLPELQKHQRDREADAVFQRSFETLKAHCVSFPKCATFHNNLAWLCARNRRELETALSHAQEALQLEPNNPAYIDTFGEVQFYRGKIDDAIASADRCVKLDPRSKHYQQQLARFTAAKAGGD